MFLRQLRLRARLMIGGSRLRPLNNGDLFIMRKTDTKAQGDMAQKWMARYVLPVNCVNIFPIKCVNVFRELCERSSYECVNCTISTAAHSDAHRSKDRRW